MAEGDLNSPGEQLLWVASLFGSGGEGIVAEDRKENEGSPLDPAPEAVGQQH
jgi:hypothetical protein